MHSITFFVILQYLLFFYFYMHLKTKQIGYIARKTIKNFWNYTNAHTRQIFWIIILSAWLMVKNTTKPKIPWKNYWKPTIAIKIFRSTWAISINNKGKPVNRRNVTGKQSKKLFRKIQQSLIWPINLKISGNIAGRSRLISKAGYFWKNRMPFWKN